MDYCISDECADGIGLKAFLILNGKESSLIKDVMKNDCLLNATKEVFLRKEPHVRILNRLASLITLAVEQNNENITKFCIFLYDFLPYCSEFLIFNLYFVILKNDSSLMHLQKCLVINSIPDYISRYLMKNEVNDDETIISLIKISL